MLRNSLKISGERAETFLQQVITSKVSSLKSGGVLSSLLLDKDACLLDIITLKREGEDNFLMVCSNPKKTKLAKSWLEELSNGYVIFDEDILVKINGPVVIEETQVVASSLVRRERKDITKTIYKNHPELFSLSKPYFIGQKRLREIISFSKPEKKIYNFKNLRLSASKKEKLKRTPLYREHLKRGARMISFAGWEMPIFYSNIIREHQAVRSAAALFDIGHMGIIEIKGKGATNFLNIITTNYVWCLKNGESFYAFILSPDGEVMDDVMVYRRNKKDYFLVCNSINQEKIRHWLNSVNSKQYLIDENYPEKEIEEKVILRNLKEQKTILALQGPNSLSILKNIIAKDDVRRLKKLQKREFMETSISGKEVMVAYTGYTGEKIGFELFVSPAESIFIWNSILKEGKELGVIPAGLGARDSTRIEAGFPLYGHELAGKFNISPIEAGLGFYVKFHKPYFIGREALLRKKISNKIILFEMLEKAIPREGYPVIFQGKKIGEVTSGTFSSSANKYIGLAYVALDIGKEFEIEIRGKNYKAKII